MPKKVKARTDFEKLRVISAFYSGGKVLLLRDARILVCSYKEVLNFIDSSSGSIIAIAKHDEGDEISSFCVTNELLVTISKNMLVKKWVLPAIIKEWEKSEDGFEQQTLESEKTWKAVHQQPVTCSDLDPSGSLLVTGSSDATAKVYDLTRQYHTHNVKCSGIMKVAKFWIYQKTFFLVTADANGHVQITHLESKKCIFSEEAHFGAVLDLKLSSDQMWFVTVGRDCLATVWRPDSVVGTSESKVALRISKISFTVNEVAEALIVPKSGQVGHLPVDSVGADLFVTVGSRGVFKVWDTHGKCVQAFGKLSSQQMESEDSSLAPIATMEQLGTHFVAASHNNDIFFYNLETLKVSKMFSGDVEEISSTCFVGGNLNLVAVASKSKFLKLVNLETSHVQITCAHSEVIISVSSSSDGSLVATTSKDNSAKLWMFDSIKTQLVCVASMVGHTMDVLDAQFFVNSRDFLCTVSEDLTLKVWKIKLPQSVTPDAEVKNLKCVWTIKAHDKQINCCKVSPNNELVVTGSHDKLVKVWNLKTESLETVLSGHRKGVWAIDFSLHEQLVASASGDTTVKLWNLANSSCMATFEGHDCAVIQVRFFNRSSQLVTSATNGLIKVWNAKTSESNATLDAHTDKVWSLCVFESDPERSPETSEVLIVSAGGDASLVVWKDVTLANKTKKFEEQSQVLSQMQAMENLLLEQKYLQAIKLAIKLNQPYRLMSILEKILSKKEVATQLGEIISELNEEDLIQLLKFCVIWNSNSKNCHSAQIIMEIVFKSWDPSTLIELPGVCEVVEQLLCYQERHLDRLEKLQKDASLLDFTSFCINETSS